MAIERTLAICKPDAVQDGNVGHIIARIEASGLKIAAMKLMQLSRKQAEGFYYVHKDRPFFGDLCSYMTSGPVVLMALEGEGAIKKWRDLMGATDPAKAVAGTIRADYGTSIERNASHGSDAPETAAFETGYFFNVFDLVYEG
jgi:nucleoside-diphosphate kinase